MNVNSHAQECLTDKPQSSAATVQSRLAAMLHDDDEGVVQYAERRLWQLWMNAGSPQGNERLALANRLIARDDFDASVEVLSALATREPDFAEAHHQRGLALALLGRPREALESGRRAASLNPIHFAARVGLGSAYVALGEFAAALREFQRALRIHPRLDGVAELIDRTKGAVRQGQSQHRLV